MDFSLVWMIALLSAKIIVVLSDVFNEILKKNVAIKFRVLVVILVYLETKNISKMASSVISSNKLILLIAISILVIVVQSNIITSVLRFIPISKEVEKFIQIFSIFSYKGVVKR